MIGKRQLFLLGLACLGMALASPVSGQEAGETAKIRPRPGLGIEYFSRTLIWDQDQYTSKLKASIAVLRAEVIIQKGFSAALLAGYNLSNFNGLIFRGLPFSLDYEAGSLGSIFWGAELEKDLFTAGNFEIGAAAQFVMSLGSSKTFPITGLNQDGESDGKGTWNRIMAGPVVRYTGYEKWTPFLSVAYNALEGKFSMKETIGELAGTEEKSVKSKGMIGVTLGTIYEPSSVFRIRGEVTALPYNKLGGGLDVDYGASLKAVFSF